MNELQIPPPSPEGLTMIERAMATKVVTEDDYKAAIAVEMGLNALVKEIKETFDPLAKRAHDAHRAITTERAKQLAAPEQAIRHLQSLREAWTREQRAIAERERLRLEAAQRREAEDAALAAAAELEAEGYRELAEIALDVRPVSATTKAWTPPKVAGAVSSGSFSATVTDFRAFVLWCVKTARFELLAVDQSALNALAKSSKGAIRPDGAKVEATTQTRYRT